MNSWDFKFLGLAEYISSWSHDPDIKVGAVLANPINPREYYSGYNGFPRNIKDHDHRYTTKSVKHSLIVHAELNAIFNAQRDLSDFTLYCTRFPCYRCALAILQSGITRIITNVPSDTDIWKHKSEYEHTLNIINEGMIGIILIDNNEIYLMKDFIHSIRKSGERSARDK